MFSSLSFCAFHITQMTGKTIASCNACCLCLIWTPPSLFSLSLLCIFVLNIFFSDKKLQTRCNHSASPFIGTKTVDECADKVMFGFRHHSESLRVGIIDKLIKGFEHVGRKGTYVSTTQMKRAQNEATKSRACLLVFLSLKGIVSSRHWPD